MPTPNPQGDEKKSQVTQLLYIPSNDFTRALSRQQPSTEVREWTQHEEPIFRVHLIPRITPELYTWLQIVYIFWIYY